MFCRERGVVSFELSVIVGESVEGDQVAEKVALADQLRWVFGGSVSQLLRSKTQSRVSGPLMAPNSQWMWPGFCPLLSETEMSLD